MKRRKKDVSKIIEQRKLLGKDKTKDIKICWKITEKRENGKYEKVQKKVPLDIIEID